VTVAQTTRVVLADDHPVVRNGLATIISQQPDMVVVAEAEDGEQAITLFERHRPDVMIVDLRMPRCDGLEVVRRVHEAHPDACLMVMSAYDIGEAIYLSISYGALGYLLKDAPRQEILAAIRCVSQNRLFVPPSLAVKALHWLSEPRLTGRNREVLRLVAAGYTNKAIARQLGITVESAKMHVRELFAKVKIDSRVHAVAVANERFLAP
jgi:two-component system, NarL family, response regulator